MSRKVDYRNLGIKIALAGAAAVCFAIGGFPHRSYTAGARNERVLDFAYPDKDVHGDCVGLTFMIRAMRVDFVLSIFFTAMLVLTYLVGVARSRWPKALECLEYLCGIGGFVTAFIVFAMMIAVYTLRFCLRPALSNDSRLRYGAWFMPAGMILVVCAVFCLKPYRLVPGGLGRRARAGFRKDADAGVVPLQQRHTDATHTHFDDMPPPAGLQSFGAAGAAPAVSPRPLSNDEEFGGHVESGDDSGVGNAASGGASPSPLHPVNPVVAAAGGDPLGTANSSYRGKLTDTSLGGMSPPHLHATPTRRLHQSPWASTSDASLSPPPPFALGGAALDGPWRRRSSAGGFKAPLYTAPKPGSFRDLGGHKRRSTPDHLASTWSSSNGANASGHIALDKSGSRKPFAPDTAPWYTPEMSQSQPLSVQQRGSLVPSHPGSASTPPHSGPGPRISSTTDCIVPFAPEGEPDAGAEFDVTSNMLVRRLGSHPFVRKVSVNSGARRPALGPPGRRLSSSLKGIDHREGATVV